MSKVGISVTLTALLSLVMLYAAPGRAQVVLIEDSVTVEPPATVEQRLLVQPTATVTTSQIELSTEPVLRSNYKKRLVHILEQINMAEARGWLSPARAAELKAWQDDVVKTEERLRAAGGGIIPEAKLAQMEKYVNGLQFVLSTELSGNKRDVAVTTTPVF